MVRGWLAAGLCVALALPVAAQSLSEAEAVARMRAEHPQAAALRFGVREFAADARGRTLPPNPAVAYTREEAGAAVDDFLLVSQELPLRGRRRLLGEAAGHAVSARAAEADARLLAVEAELRLVFADLLLAQERVRSLAAGAGRLDGLIAVLRTREEQGEGSRFDRLRAEREAAEVDADRALADIARRQAQARLAAFFAAGTDPDGLTAAGRLDDYPPPEPAPAPSPEGRHDYRALGLEAARWGAEGRAARRLRLPSAQVTGGLKRSTGPGSTGAGLGLTDAGLRSTGAGFEATGAGFGSTGTGFGSTGAGFGSTGAGLGSTGAGIGSTGAGLGSTGAGLGSTGVGFVLGASVSVPLFDRGQAQAARASAARARVEAERQVLAARIAAEVRAASAAAVGERELADRYRAESVARADELVAIATAAYEEGEFGILELLDAHRVSLRANLRSLDLSASARRAAVELDRAAGRGMTP